MSIFAGTLAGTVPAEEIVMISIAKLRGGATAAVYYLERGAGCEADYYLKPEEAKGRWIGHGAEALGLVGDLGDAGEAVFRRLLAGQHPGGTQLSRPVMRDHVREMLPVAPLLDAIKQAAEDLDVEPAVLIGDSELVTQHHILVRQVADAKRPDEPVAKVGDLDRLAQAAGVDPGHVYDADRLSEARKLSGTKVDVRRAGYDLQVSPPKSVSVLHGLGQPAVAAHVRHAHEAGVNAAVGYLERVASHAIRGHKGGPNDNSRRISTDGLIAAVFTHQTSRADDPQLHTHVVVANLLHGSDGGWSAVDSRALHLHARAAGCIYQAVLRGELTERLGVEWTTVRRGVAEIAGIPKSVLRMFSQRREDIVHDQARTGATGRRAAQAAAYRTRPRKSHNPVHVLRDQWRAKVRAAGHDPDGLGPSVLNRTRPPAMPSVADLATHLLGPKGLTEKKTSYDRRDVISTLTEVLPTGVVVEGEFLERLADTFLADPDAVRLLASHDLDAGPRFTTYELLRVELLALERCQSTSATVVPAAAIDAALSGRPLSRGQQAAVRAVLGSPRTVEVALGPAGSGKTAALAVARRAWSAAGFPVVGAALAAVTARRLEAATGIRSSSLARLLGDLQEIDPATGRPGGLAPGTVVVVDEASMVGTRHLGVLLDHVNAANGKLVLVGDPGQLPEVEAGGLFRVLPAQHQPIVLAGNQRQTQQWERNALEQLRDGDIAPALDTYLVNDRVHIGRDAADIRERIADAYVRRREAVGPYDVVVLASRRSDVDLLNETIRRRLRDAGQLRSGPDIEDLPLAKGDLVQVTRNDYKRGLLNGMRAQVTKVDASSVTLRTEAGASVSVTRSWAERRLTHAYALTVHKAQGLTVDTCLLYGTGALCQQAGYVGMSRGRESNHIFTAMSAFAADDTGVIVGEPKRFELMSAGPDPAEVLSALRERLAEWREHVLASKQRPAIDVLKRLQAAERQAQPRRLAR